MPRTRSAVAWCAIGALVLLVGGTLLLLVHPVLFTGRYYEITIRSVHFGPQGMVSLTYDDALTYGTEIAWKYGVARGHVAITDTWEGGRRPFLGWPRQERERTLGLYLTTEKERATGVDDSPAVRQRWLLKEGTYRVRPGDRLILARTQNPDGTVSEASIEVRPAP
jgi:hypothetical protein